MEWSRDLESGGGGFDSRLPFEIFRMSWEVSGSGLGTFLDRFGKILKKCPRGSENENFQN